MPSIRLDFESLENGLRTFQTSHDTLTGVTSTMNSTLAQIDWDSPAATQFRDAWNTKYYKQLQEIASAVQAFNSDLSNQLQRYKTNEGIG
jgi:hypothetical protein